MNLLEFLGEYLIVGWAVTLALWALPMIFGVESSFYFEKRDLWIGLYWNYQDDSQSVSPLAGTGLHGLRPGTSVKKLDIYVCVLPLVPVRLHWERE